MKLHKILIIGLALSLSGCAEKEQPATEPQPDQEMKAAAPVVEEAAGMSESQSQAWRTEAFIEHMHAHAEKLDDLNFALDDGDLVGAMGPAYWLARHDEVDGIPTDWQPFLTGMREAALAVEDSRDLDSARAAASKIGEQCQGCHEAAGVAGYN